MGQSAKKRSVSRPLEARHVSDLTWRELADAGRRAGEAAAREAAEAGITFAAVRDGEPVWVRPDGSVEPTTWEDVRVGYRG